ncbi:MAG: 4-hydroxy-3-methylbut-2-enyl diphosphate reductase [Candidatus Cloacimonadota bacterium]|nr:4-hydroxy-3-methylbut-2-enyl diphosphate reductase [Candidatus Cloacimonadota bacterium]
MEIIEKKKVPGDIYILGPIIHNPQVVNGLKEKKIFPIDELSEINNRPTILRSHGVAKEVIKYLEDKNIEIIDATCPYVSRTQSYGKELDEQGYQVIILGDKNHPEVTALSSYINNKHIIVESIENLPEKLRSKIGVICQTTQRAERLEELVSYLLPITKELRIFNTICNATSIRQKATFFLAKDSDIMIVIGGKNSSNTKQLALISQKYVTTYHIETSQEIVSDWFENKYKIGLTAGASTPDWCILEVYNKIVEYSGKDIDKKSNVDDIPGYK